MKQAQNSMQPPKQRQLCLKNPNFKRCHNLETPPLRILFLTCTIKDRIVLQSVILPLLTFYIIAKLIQSAQMKLRRGKSQYSCNPEITIQEGTTNGKQCSFASTISISLIQFSSHLAVCRPYMQTSAVRARVSMDLLCFCQLRSQSKQGHQCFWPTRVEECFQQRYFTKQNYLFVNAIQHLYFDRLVGLLQGE